MCVCRCLSPWSRFLILYHPVLITPTSDLINQLCQTLPKIHTHIHAHTFTQTHSHIHIHTNPHTHTHTHTCVYTHTHTHTNMHTQACAHIHTHVFTHTHTHKHTHPGDASQCVLRSEEHTSELQSHLNLVCRLL